MKTLRLMGGLGNQMFQYAFGVLLGADVCYDTSWFDKCRNNKNITPREYELDFWNINPRLTNKPKTRILGFIKVKKIIEHPANIYNPELLKIKSGVIQGYFQVAKYYGPVRAQLLQDFTPRNNPNAANKKILDLIHTTNSVSLHIRRGDYVKLQQVHGLCDLDYYKRGIEYIANKIRKPHFFIFSDDTEWVLENLKIDFPYTVVDINHGRDSAWDMYLMMQCKHNIIANSSFSWWGAWLNQNPAKIVIAPLRWFADGTATDIVPQEWQRI
ncbi:MAG: alpha-1,2-fucosyltransferase [Alphaproteobacteria bacterium]|nr:alpha-1,2-fucosyltransferase [Alphaproteobacteria bacterium]